MDMFGGLQKTSSRITIATALGLTLGMFAMSASPAKAGALGGDCCADLEERVAELEATTVRKGNKKVSVTISGWVVKAFNVWDDGDISDTWVGDKDADLATRFAITGEAQISPGWSAGYNLTVTAPGDWAGDAFTGNVFGILSSQFAQDSGLLNGINTLYSYMYIKSDKWGTINWGELSPASDNPAVLADISGTVIESNAVLFEGPGFFLRPSGAAPGTAGLSPLTWGSFATCLTGIGPIGADCYGAPQSGVRYDSPTIGGFRFEASATNVYGTNTDAYDIAVFYSGDWGNFKVSAAYAYTHVLPVGFDVDLHQTGASVMHVPSGLGIYGLYQYEEADIVGPASDNNAWYLKPFLKRTFMPMGATTFFGEYGEYSDQFSGIAGTDVCAALGAATGPCFVNSSEIERWGLGVVQEIDAAAMHLYARWQHQELDFSTTGPGTAPSVEDWDLFQVGGVIFF